MGLTWNPFTGVYLVGLGFSISKLVPDQVISRWTGYDSIPKVLALALIVESILWSITGGHNQVSANGLSIKLGTLGVASGFTLSVCGMMIGLMPNLVKFNQAPLRVLAGGSLALVVIQVFGTRVNPGLFEKPVYALVPVVAVLIGLVLGFVH